MAREERPVVRMEGRPTVAELELAVGEIRKAGRPVVQAAGRQVHREAAHLAGAAEERTASHAGQLLEAALFGALVLEPDLRASDEEKSVRNRVHTDMRSVSMPHTHTHIIQNVYTRGGEGEASARACDELLNK